MLVRRTLSFFLTLSLSLTALLAPPAARAADETGNVFPLAGEGRVVLAPLNLGVRFEAELEAGLGPVWEEILHHFAGFDPPPRSLERESALALWSRVTAESEDEEGRGIYEAYARFARRLAEQVDYGVLVMPSLVPRVARLRGHQASWDGVQRPVELPLEVAEGTETVIADGLEVLRNGVRGELRAASLHVVVLAPDGTLRFEGAGGLTLLQDVELGDDGKLAAAARSEPFADPEPLRQGIAAAFERPLPASRSR